MGGYGGYVWPAYVASIVILALLAFAIRRRSKRLEKEINRRGDRE